MVFQNLNEKGELVMLCLFTVKGIGCNALKWWSMSGVVNGIERFYHIEFNRSTKEELQIDILTD